MGKGLEVVTSDHRQGPEPFPQQMTVGGGDLLLGGALQEMSVGNFHLGHRSRCQLLFLPFSVDGTGVCRE